MSKIIEEDLIFSPDYVEVCSVKFELDDETLENIKKAQKVLEDNPFLSCVDISNYFGMDIQQFNGTLDDEDRKEIPYSDFGYFRSDCETIKVFKGGAIYLRAYNKWDGSQFYEVEINL